MTETKKMQLSEPLDYKELPELAKVIQDDLRKSIIAQDRAIDDTVKKYITSIFADPERPKGVLFFAGPTGVGKTELVKIFAKHLFGNKNAVTRVDCNVLKSDHDIWRLIGSPAGLVGFNERNRLFDQRQIDKWGFFKQIKKDLRNPAYKDKLAEKFTSHIKESIIGLKKQIGKYEANIFQLENHGDYHKKQNDWSEDVFQQILSDNKKGLIECQRELGKLEGSMSKLDNNPDILLDMVKSHYESLIKKIYMMKESLSGRDEATKLQVELEELEKKLDYKPGAYESIILFDEFEKVHPSLYDPILSIVDESRLALSDNTVIKFNNSYIFFTSNIGSGEIKRILRESMGQSSSVGFRNLKENVMSEAKAKEIDKKIYDNTLAAVDKFFIDRPELLGRIGKENITVFRPFEKIELEQIFEKCTIPGFQQLVKDKYDINLIIDESFKFKIVEDASDIFNRPLGARPLLRITKNKLFEPLCILLLKEAISKGDTVVVSAVESTRNGENSVAEKKWKAVFRKEIK